MSTPLWTTTCDVYRPFGDASPTETGIACRLVPDLVNGLSSTPTWTHYVDLPAGTDVRDGCGRTAGSPNIDYADGDELRIPNEDGARFVVVWVEDRNQLSPAAFRRAYLSRHEAGPAVIMP